MLISLSIFCALAGSKYNRKIHIRMKKTCSLFSIKQKKKNFLALCIRSCLLVAIPLFYFISTTNFNGNSNSIQQGRKKTNLFTFHAVNTEYFLRCHYTKFLHYTMYYLLWNFLIHRSVKFFFSLLLITFIRRSLHWTTLWCWKRIHVIWKVQRSSLEIFLRLFFKFKASILFTEYYLKQISIVSNKHVSLLIIIRVRFSIIR